MVSSLIPGHVLAAKWEVEPSITGIETYTDNVGLSVDQDRRSDWVTQVIPGISVSAKGDRLRFNANYAPEITYYAGGSYDNQIFQRGGANGTVEFADQLLFMDFAARVDQYDVSLQGPIGVSNVNDTGNRATVATYLISPYLRHSFGSEAQVEARFTGSAVESDRDEAMSDSTAQRVDLSAKSGPAYKVLTWGVDYFREQIVYDGNGRDDTISESVIGKGRRLLTSTTGLIARAGYESYDQGGFAPVSEGALWALGMDWNPSSRTKLEATAGHRFYGEAYSLDLSHRSRLTTLQVKYDEYVSSTRSEFLVPGGVSSASYLDTLFSTQFPDPVARQKAVQDFIARTGLPPELANSVNFFDDELFLAKRWQISAGILGVRNVLIGNFYKERRKSLEDNPLFPTGVDFSGSDSIGQTGVGFQWNLRLDAKMAWNLGASFSQNEFADTNRTDDLFYLGMGLTRQLEPRTYASLNYRRQDNDSNVSTGSYVENAIFASIQHRF